MKTKKTIPTPAELAAFMVAIGCGEKLRETWHGVTLATGFKPDSRVFQFGLGQWREWEEQIAAAHGGLEDRNVFRNDVFSRVPLAEVERMVAKDHRTLRKLYFAIGAKSDAEKRYADQVRNGFLKINVVRMCEERDRRASERARKGAAAKAEKQRKKFEQEKEREVQQQAAPTQQQAGKKRTPRRSKRKP